MSNFLTPIPIHLDKLETVLPPGSTIERVEYNAEKQRVEVFWFNGKLQTKYYFPLEFTTEQLEKGALPEGVETAQQVIDRKQAEIHAKAVEAMKAAEAAAEKQAEEKKAAIARAAKLAQEQIKEKVLTGNTAQTKTTKIETMDRKPEKKARRRPAARRSTASAAAVDRTGHEPVTGVLVESHG